MQAKRFCLMASAVLAACLSRAATVYVDANSTAENPDGKSWETAYASVADGVAALNGSDGEATLEIAEGVYHVSAAQVITKDNYLIRGGWRISGDTPIRDATAYPTILSGAPDPTDATKCFWSRCVPNESTLTTDNTQLKSFGGIVQDGRICYPEYTGDYDFFQTSNNGIVGTGAFTVNTNVGGTFDGLQFVLFKRNGNVITITSSQRTTIRGCVFSASLCNACVNVNSAAGALIEDCVFKHNLGDYGAAAMALGNSTDGYVVRNCRIEGAHRVHQGDPAVVNVNWHAYSNIFENCVFTRCVASYSTDQKDNPSAVLRFGSSTVSGCVFSNCLALSASSYPRPLIDIARNYSGGSYPKSVGGCLKDCVVANSRLVCDVTEERPYVLIGPSQNYETFPTYLNCVFSNNSVKVRNNTLVAGKYALGIVGNSGRNDGAYQSVVGCTFDSNFVEADAKEGVTMIPCRGVLACGLVANSKAQAGVANCTFRGPGNDGVYDVVQFGAGWSQPFNVFNCLFESSEGDVVQTPVYADIPTRMIVRNCTIRNLVEEYRTSAVDVTAGLCTDPIPFEVVPTLGSEAVHYRPAARTPGIRSTWDISLNRVTLPLSFAYRESAESAWQPLVSKVDATVVVEPGELQDAFGVTRTRGAQTRGAVQALTDTAENGWTLTVRPHPYSGGTVSAGATKAVAKGASAGTVEAFPIEGRQFIGWLNEDETPYGPQPTANPLTLGALDGDTVLLASFGGKQVMITYDLGPAATFVAGGTTVVCETSAGGAMPAVPAYVMNDGFVDLGWDLPVVAPEEDATYRLRSVTTALRIVHVVPGGAGRQDGTDWANAYGDLAAAYADAGQYRGEVWLKGGTYLLAAPIPMLSNVAVRGGFAGDETSADAADPAAHPAVLTGDVNGDDVWLRNGAEEVGPVWVGGSFNAPNPGRVDEFWSVGNAAENTASAFANEVGAVTNVAFVGLTFADFRNGALQMTSGESPALEVRTCRFLVCNASASDGGAAVVVQDGALEMADSTMVGCSVGVRIRNETVARTNRLVCCDFEDNRNTALAWGSVQSSCLELKSCDFSGNYASSGRASAADISMAIGSSLRVEDSHFESNVATGACRSTVFLRCDVSDNKYVNYQNFTRCRFVRNRVSRKLPSGENGAPVAGAIITELYSSVMTVIDTYFGENTAAGDGNSTMVASAFVCNTFHSDQQFVNCTFDGNAATHVSGSGGAVATVASGNAYNRQAFMNCMFVGNAFAPSANDTAAEYVSTSSSNNGQDYVSLFNTVMTSAQAGYQPIRSTTDYQSAILRDCSLQGYSAASIGATVRTEENVSTDDALVGSLETGANGVLARGVRALSPFRCAGRGIWQSTSGDDVSGTYWYYYHPTTGYFWSRVNGTSSLRSESDGAALGLFFANPPPPDAFGRVRRRERIAYGPLNAPPLGLIIMVR